MWSHDDSVTWLATNCKTGVLSLVCMLFSLFLVMLYDPNQPQFSRQVPGYFPGIKRPKREINHSPSINFEVSNVTSFTTKVPMCLQFILLLHKGNFILPFIFILKLPRMSYELFLLELLKHFIPLYFLFVTSGNSRAQEY